MTYKLKPAYEDKEEPEETLVLRENKRKGFWAYFIPGKEHTATIILMDINICIFLIMVISGVGIFEPSTLALLQWGADFGPLTLTGDWWRTIACNFVHIGIFHLVFNMYAFLYVGVMLETLIGMRRMVISYLLTGVCSAAFSLYLHAETISAGASGAIFGLYGIFLAFLFFHRIPKEQRKALLASILIFVGYNLLYGMKEGIDNAAHIGGLLSGFLLGIIYVIGYRFEKKKVQRMISIIGELVIFGIFLFCFLLLSRNVPSSYAELRKEWQSGVVQAYLDGKLNEEDNIDLFKKKVTGEASSPQLIPYIPAGDKDTWLSYYDAPTGFSCRYPTNWTKFESPQAMNSHANLPIFQLTNGANLLTVTVVNYDTQDAYEHARQLSRHLPRNAQGKPSEDYKQTDITVNGLPMIKTANPLHIGAPDEEGYEMQQISLLYFEQSKRRVYSIVMLLMNEEARQDAEAISSSIQIAP